jgi:glycosyltransferase involved in cell wall biosynthesis
MRVTLVISSMRGGGSERVVSHMANHWARQGWPITVLTICHGLDAPCYPLDPRVVHRDMKFSRALRQPMPSAPALSALKGIFDACSPPERRRLLVELNLVTALRRAIAASRPQVVISFISATNVRTLLATRGLDVPVIVSERTDPYRDALSEGIRRLRRRLYAHAAYMVGQTQEIAAFFAGAIGDRARVIHNPVLPPAFHHPPDVAVAKVSSGPIVAAMGRLVEEKGFMLLLRAFAAVAAKHPTWSLEIWGEGPERPRLERLAQNLNVKDRVRLPGFTGRPFDALRRADLFALSSLSEGFPNALCEAMACGLPAVAFDCSSGVREIVRDGVDGVIVPAANVPALAAALNRVMTDDGERRRLAARAVEVVDRFAVDKVMAQWEQLAFSSVSTPRVSASAPAAHSRVPAPVEMTSR